VFENDKEMKAHAASLREEEWRFVQERFHQGHPKLKLKFRQRTEDSTNQLSSSSTRDNVQHPPSYSDPDLSHDSEPGEAILSNQNQSADERAKRQRVEGEFNGVLPSSPRSGDELPDYNQIV